MSPIVCNSVTTDSSAPSSGWGSGVRIFNGWVNMLPVSTKLTPIRRHRARQRPSSGPRHHAYGGPCMPAGFVAVQNRFLHQTIARRSENVYYRCELHLMRIGGPW